MLIVWIVKVNIYLCAYLTRLNLSDSLSYDPNISLGANGIMPNPYFANARMSKFKIYFY